MVIRGNNFKDFDDSIFIKWIIKAVCGVILVANTYYIASALFSFGTNGAACILLSVMTPMIDATGANVHVLVAFWNASWTGALTAFIVAWLYNSRLYKDAAAEAKKAEEKQASTARGGSRA